MNSHPCPHCGRQINGAAPSSIRFDRTSPEPSPSPGDLSVCVYCAGLVVFNDDLTARKLEAAELLELEFEERLELKAAQATVTTIQRLFGVRR